MSIELVKPRDEPTQMSHFMRTSQEKTRAKIVFAWLREQLKETPLTLEQLEERFTREFCEQSPKILILSGTGYRPESGEDLFRYLGQFVKARKVVLEEGKYMLFPTI